MLVGLKQLEAKYAFRPFRAKSIQVCYCMHALRNWYTRIHSDLFASMLAPAWRYTCIDTWYGHQNLFVMRISSTRTGNVIMQCVGAKINHLTVMNFHVKLAMDTDKMNFNKHWQTITIQWIHIVIKTVLTWVSRTKSKVLCHECKLTHPTLISNC